MSILSGARPPQPANGRVIYWLLGIAGAVIATGIVTNINLLWNMNASIVALNASQRGTTERMASLETAIAAAVATRYTSGDASRDREMTTEVTGRLRNDITRVLERLSVVEVQQARVTEKLWGSEKK